MSQRRREELFRKEIWQERLGAVLISWKAFLLIFALGVVALVLGRSAAPSANAVAQHEVARMVRFGSYATDEGDRPLITVSLADGATRQLWIRRPQLQTCRVGDDIRLLRRGDVLRVHPKACLPE